MESLNKQIELLDIEMEVLDDKMKQLLREKRMYELALQDIKIVLRRSQRDFDIASDKKISLYEKNNLITNKK